MTDLSWLTPIVVGVGVIVTVLIASSRAGVHFGRIEERLAGVDARIDGIAQQLQRHEEVDAGLRRDVHAMGLRLERIEARLEYHIAGNGKEQK